MDTEYVLWLLVGVVIHVAMVFWIVKQLRADVEPQYPGLLKLLLVFVVLSFAWSVWTSTWDDADAATAAPAHHSSDVSPGRT